MSTRTLDYWHKLEHFYPYTLKEYSSDYITTYHVHDKEDWFTFDNLGVPKDKEIRYYEVYFGIFKVDSALQTIAQTLQAEDEFYEKTEDESCFCQFRLMPNKKFDPESFRVSSFPWAVGRLQVPDKKFSSWEEEFGGYQKELFLDLWNEFMVGTFNYEACEKIRSIISKRIGWNIKFSNFWIRIDRVIGNLRGNYKEKNLNQKRNEFDQKNEEEKQKWIDEMIRSNDLLNSFYIRDLEHIINNITNDNYGAALKTYLTQEKIERIDVENDKDILFEFFNPKKMPYGKWPSGYSLRSMQQLAVNISMGEEEIPIFSVNGPPGTGKTTLLRDIIAANIVERAIELSKYKAPDDVFTKKVGEVSYANFTNSIKDIQSPLKKYGILVTSNNNAAVKNITMELPDKSSLSERYRESYSYFNKVSDQILEKENGSWGLCAAAMGNRANCAAFMDIFWPIKVKSDEAFDLNQYLTKQKKTIEVCIENWQKAKTAFSIAYNKVQEVYEGLENYYQYLKLLRERDILYQNVYNEDLILSKKGQKKIKPVTFLQKFAFFTQMVSNNINQYAYKKQLRDYDRKIQIAFEKIQSIHLPNDMVLPNEEFLNDLIGKNSSEDYKKAQDMAPWSSETLNELRERLFLEAMNLHKAFLENSFQMREQLDAFSKMMRGKLTRAEEYQFAGILFQSFMLAVPVISTTFASVGNFLKYIKKEEFGLLLIDEAGQALPQSAVGSIWRAKKVIVVGDPLQIDPVMTIHDKTIQMLQKEFDQTHFIASKETSVQSVADGRNRYIGVRSIANKELYIGSPLLVHVRCQKKIFDIANNIAYNNKMIYGTQNSQNTSCIWIDVKGTAENKHFVRAQAEQIVPIVKVEFQNIWSMEGKKNLPSLFVISPFRSVKDGLIRYFQDSDFLYQCLCKIPDKENKKLVDQWIHNNIGTVHTFQGKEAKTVIICLGVDSGDKGNGAIEWVSKSPNILNVAVTRAKNNLYIVGDSSKWKSKPYFNEAYRICDKR